MWTAGLKKVARRFRFRQSWTSKEGEKMRLRRLPVNLSDSTLSAINKLGVKSGKSQSEIARELIDFGLENRLENERLTFPSGQFSPKKEDPRLEEILTTVHEMAQILRKTLNPTTNSIGETDKKLSALAESLSKFPDLFEAQGKKLEEKHRELFSQIPKFHEAKINESFRELLSGIEKKIGGLGERLTIIEDQQRKTITAINARIGQTTKPGDGKRAWKQVGEGLWSQLLDLLPVTPTGWIFWTLILLVLAAVGYIFY